MALSDATWRDSRGTAHPAGRELHPAPEQQMEPQARSLRSLCRSRRPLPTRSWFPPTGQKISHVQRLVRFCTYNHGMVKDVRERVFTTISGVPVDEVYTP